MREIIIVAQLHHAPPHDVDVASVQSLEAHRRSRSRAKERRARGLAIRTPLPPESTVDHQQEISEVSSIEVRTQQLGVDLEPPQQTSLSFSSEPRYSATVPQQEPSKDQRAGRHHQLTDLQSPWSDYQVLRSEPLFSTPGRPKVEKENKTTPMSDTSSFVGIGKGRNITWSNSILSVHFPDVEETTEIGSGYNMSKHGSRGVIGGIGEWNIMKLPQGIFAALERCWQELGGNVRPCKGYRGNEEATIWKRMLEPFGLDNHDAETSLLKCLTMTPGWILEAFPDDEPVEEHSTVEQHRTPWRNLSDRELAMARITLKGATAILIQQYEPDRFKLCYVNDLGSFMISKLVSYIRKAIDIGENESDIKLGETTLVMLHGSLAEHGLYLLPTRTSPCWWPQGRSAPGE
ncbi:hypothetical protein DE146DRAFT_631667 [Phaeosphaeria sp. MPI-PUGE-AT-0046c]|nr:hypothetical protein DE146DRAFT_631667 [Phaeosphaeria sp. MPI-PUGE-AT-0046c]